MEDNPHLLQPLIPPSATASPPLDDDNLKSISSNSGIILRLTLVAFIGIVSIWANHEASKGYALTIVNESTNTFLAKRFQLYYLSNDEATRTVIKASNIIQNFLFPNSDNSPKKPIKSVILKLVNRNLTDSVIVEEGNDEDQFVLNISHSVMGCTNFGRDVALAIRRGVARIWLWDGRGNAPNNLINGIVEYLVINCLDINSSNLSPRDAGELFEPITVCWDANNPRVVAEFLKHGEHRRPGFVRRLNRAMKDGWNDEKLGGALGLPVHKLCATSESLWYNSSSV